MAILWYSESESRSVLSDSLRPQGLCSPWHSPGENSGVGSLSLLQGIFTTQASNPDLLYYRPILYQLSHKGSPRILEWVAMPSYSGSSQLRDQTRVSCIADEFFTNWAIREANTKRMIITLLSFLPFLSLWDWLLRGEKHQQRFFRKLIACTQYIREVNLKTHFWDLGSTWRSRRTCAHLLQQEHQNHS